MNHAETTTQRGGSLGDRFGASGINAHDGRRGHDESASNDDGAGPNGAEDGTRTRYRQPRSVRTLRVRDGGLDLVRHAA
jgi:hypothetical protein